MSAPTTTIEDATAAEQVPQAQQEAEPLPVRETFIPITRIALIDRLAKEEARTGGGAPYASCANLFRHLAVWRHQTYQLKLARMKECYLPFSPDRDTKRIMKYDRQQMVDMQRDLVDHLELMLKQANYTQIDEEKLNHLLEANSAHGLELVVDLSEFDEMLLFARGREIDIIEKRVPDNLYLFKRRFEVPIYRRLFLLLKLKSSEKRIWEIVQEHGVSEKKAWKILKKKRSGLPDDPNGDYIYLRLFKDIPQEDLEMMFPNTEVRLKLFDKVKLGVTAGGGTVAGIAGAASKVMAAIATANPIALAAALFGVIGVIVRQVMNVFNTRTKYMMQLAQRLFFHSLANNRGVLTLMVDRAEEEDVKEEMLLYFFLLRNPMPLGELGQNGRLDQLIEEFLKREFGITVDFDMEDAYSRLQQDGLLTQSPDGVIHALPPKEACDHLENKWRTLLATPEEVDENTQFEGEV